MRSLPNLVALAGALLASLPIAGAAAASEFQTVEEKTFAAPAGSVVDVSNISGEVHVRAVDGASVKLRVAETYRADGEDELARARREVRLAVEETPGRILLTMETPCHRRDRDGKREDCDCDWHHDYEVRFDFTLEVPRETGLRLRTVNDGDIRVEGVSGDFDVANVNGPVELEGVAGRGRAKTVNGKVTARFAALPTGDLEFGSVNGDLELAFPPGYGAELAFRTLNGDVFTDIAAGGTVTLPAVAEHDAGRHSRHPFSLSTTYRLGGGGHRLECQTVNGDIRIRTTGS